MSSPVPPARPRVRFTSPRTTWVVAGSVLAITFGVLALYVRQAAQGPVLSPICVRAYGRAHTSADTAIVDGVKLEGKERGFRTCGSQRSWVERTRGRAG